MGGEAKTKLLSYVNGGYLNFALNWLKYIRKLDMQNMVIMYCLDDESFERMSAEKDIEKCAMDKSELSYRNHFRVSSKRMGCFDVE